MCHCDVTHSNIVNATDVTGMLCIGGPGGVFMTMLVTCVIGGNAGVIDGDKDAIVMMLEMVMLLMVKMVSLCWYCK